MKYFFIIFVLGLMGALPAHAALYYTFNPDYSQSLLVASSETVSEVFLPLNDYLGALDFWVTNNSIAGNVTFTLYDLLGTAIAEQTVAVPSTAETPGGVRLRFTLPTQIAVTGNAPYRVRIATAIPSLRLYYSDAIQLLAHNAIPLPTYTGGLARIGNSDMGFSFKFALYEDQESTPPQLTAVTVTQDSPRQAIITFHANEPVDRHLQYGNVTIDYLGEYVSCAPTIQVCTLSLSVAPAVTYHYTLTVRDVWGNQSIATGTFTSLSDGQTPTPTSTPTSTLTPPPTSGPTSVPSTLISPTPLPDITAPLISNARLVTVTPHTATFAWTTNEATNSTVVAQLLPYFITVGGNFESTMELEHFVNVGGLTSDTFLRATITSADTAGNSSIALVDFTTPIETPLPSIPGATVSPTASSPQPTPQSAPTVSGPTNNPLISWSAPAGDEPTTGYRIDIFDSNNTLVKTINVPSGQLQSTLGILPEGDNRIVVYANNNGVFEKVAEPLIVHARTRGFFERAVGALPFILGGIVVITFTIVIVMKLRKPKLPIQPTTPRPSDMKTGATPNLMPL